MQNKKTTKIYEERNLSGELEKKIKYARSGVLTDQEVIGKMMRYIADLSFADFMFFKREAFEDVMTQMGFSKWEDGYPDISVGQVCDFVSEQFHQAPTARKTTQLVDIMRVPYDLVDLRIEGRPLRVHPKETTTWDSLEEKELYSELEAEGPIALEQRLQRIHNLTYYKKTKYEFHAINGILPCKYGNYWQSLVYGTSLWDIDEVLQKLTGKKITCIRKLCDDFTNPDEVNMDFSILEFCDYFLCDMNCQDKVWLFVEPFAEIYRTTKQKSTEPKAGKVASA